MKPSILSLSFVFLFLSCYAVQAQVVELRVVATDNGRPSVPSGWELVKTVEGTPADLNRGAGGRDIWVLMRKGNSISDSPILGVSMVQGEGADAPSGWIKLPQDINQGAGGDYLYITYTKTQGAPILDLMVVNGPPGSNPEKKIKPGYSIVGVNTNKGTGADTWDSYLTAKQAAGPSSVEITNASNGPITAVNSRLDVNKKDEVVATDEEVLSVIIEPGKTEVITRMGAGDVEIYEGREVIVNEKGDWRRARINLSNGERKKYSHK